MGRTRTITAERLLEDVWEAIPVVDEAPPDGKRAKAHAKRGDRGDRGAPGGRGKA